MAKQCTLNTLITLFSLHKILQKINQIMKILRALKIFSSRMFFFPKHLLHAPGRLQTFIQSWKQKYSDQALFSTHVLIWNSHIETLQCLTYTSWTSEKGLNSSFSFLCYACLKREKGTPSTQHCHPPPPKKTNLSFKPLIQPPRNWPTKFPNIFEWQKFFTQCRWLFLISSTYLGFLLSWSPWSGLKFLQSCSTERINQ